jgi:hypothetical protein
VAHEVHSREQDGCNRPGDNQEAKEVLETVLTEVRLEQEEEKNSAQRDWRKDLKKSSKKFQTMHLQEKSGRGKTQEDSTDYGGI